MQILTSSLNIFGHRHFFCWHFVYIVVKLSLPERPYPFAKTKKKLCQPTSSWLLRHVTWRRSSSQAHPSGQKPWLPVSRKTPASIVRAGFILIPSLNLNTQSFSFIAQPLCLPFPPFITTLSKAIGFITVCIIRCNGLSCSRAVEVPPLQNYSGPESTSPHGDSPQPTELLWPAPRTGLEASGQKGGPVHTRLHEMLRDFLMKWT